MTQEPKKKNKGGRPKTEWETFVSAHPNWKTIISENYAKGRTDERIRRDLRMGDAMMLSQEVFARFLEEIPEFSLAIKTGREASKLWWLETGQDNLWCEDFSPTLWFMNMKNRHAWRDKQPDEVAKVFNVSTTNVATSTSEDNLKLIEDARRLKELKNRAV
jgi:hypothetical protein